MSPTNLPYDRSAEGPLLTVQKVMTRLDCSRSFVYKLISGGKLKHVRLGDVKGMRVTEKSVERYLRRKGGDG
uniref:DNA-binding protein, excisionase family n=1 Tax=Desulfovibrio sp. U5L TaxID=596152 RepID=I2Q2Q2_9BACT